MTIWRKGSSFKQRAARKGRVAFRRFGGGAGRTAQVMFRRFGGVLWLGRCFACLGVERVAAVWGGVLPVLGGFF